MSKTPVLDEAFALVARTNGVCLYHCRRGLYSILTRCEEDENTMDWKYTPRQLAGIQGDDVI